MFEPRQEAKSDEPAEDPRERDMRDEESLDLLRRERADFLNYKRRVERERVEDRARTRDELVRQLLPVLDELDRALVRIPERLEDDPWVQGVTMSRPRVEEFLDQLGIEPIGKEGEPFDPAVHEAVSFEARPGLVANLVGEVVRPGYRSAERLIRPAQVVVAGPVAEQSAEGSERHRRE